METTKVSINRGWMKKTSHTHTHSGILLSHQKNKVLFAIRTNTGGPRACHTAWSESEKDKYRMLSLINRITDVGKQTFGYQGISRGDKPETGFDIHTLLYIKQITNEDLLCSRGNSIQCSVMTCMGKDSKKSGYIYAHTHIYKGVTDWLGCTPETNTMS